MTVESPMICLRGITKIYPRVDIPAVADLDLDIPRGEIVALVGPSGCGKTTTLKMMNRLIQPTSGQLLFDGQDVTNVPAPELRKRIGYVIQEIGLFPHKTIGENIETVPNLLKWTEERKRGRVAELAEQVGISLDMLTRYPAALSDGQRQRVGLARALAGDPPVLLMDEPMGAVDPVMSDQLQQLLLDLQHQFQKTMVIVTHDIDEAIRVGDRVAVLNTGGKLEQYGPPEEILLKPANSFVESFLGSQRGLKRLSLRSVGNTRLRRGPFIELSAGPAAARDLIAREGSAWVGLLDNGRLLGWLDADAVAGSAPLDSIPPRPFSAMLGSRNTLLEALDMIVSSEIGVAVVADGARYLGMLDEQRLNEELLK